MIRGKTPIFPAAAVHVHDQVKGADCLNFDELNSGKNRPVLEYLSSRSAHSDVAEVLENISMPPGAAQAYCPDPRNYRYLVAYANGTVFSYAAGMNTLAFRLSPDFRFKAIRTGGEAVDAIGNTWVAFGLFRSNWPEVDARSRARKACLFATGMADA